MPIQDIPPEQFAAVQAEILGDIARGEPRQANVDTATTTHDPGLLVLMDDGRTRVTAPCNRAVTGWSELMDVHGDVGDASATL